MSKYIYTIVEIPREHNLSARMAEIRVHRDDVDPTGLGYRDRITWSSGPCDARYTDPRSCYGRCIAYAKQLCADLNAGE